MGGLSRNPTPAATAPGTRRVRRSTMDYGFTEYQRAIRDLAHEIAEKEIRPVAAEYDREAKFPWPVVKVLAQTDLFRVFIDEKYGGIPRGHTDHEHGDRDRRTLKGVRRYRAEFCRHGARRAADHPLRQRGTEAAMAAGRCRRANAWSPLRSPNPRPVRTLLPCAPRPSATATITC